MPAKEWHYIESWEPAFPGPYPFEPGEYKSVWIVTDCPHCSSAHITKLDCLPLRVDSYCPVHGKQIFGWALVAYREKGEEVRVVTVKTVVKPVHEGLHDLHSGDFTLEGLMSGMAVGGWLTRLDPEDQSTLDELVTRVEEDCLDIASIRGWAIALIPKYYRRR